jgi:acyl-CoA synthetase (AMP-forming)/AMP-acid ligase II
VEFNLADLFESIADVLGDQEAMVSDLRRLSYRGLDERANRLAHVLLDAGVGPEDRIGLQLANGTEYVEAMLACFKIRAVPVNVNYRYVAAELRYLYADAGLVGLIFHQRFAPAVFPALEALAERRVLLEVAEPAEEPQGGGDGEAQATDYEKALAEASPVRDFGPRSADDLYCVYTGGTTGMPKGVLWRQEDIFFAAMGGGDPLSLGDFITVPEDLASRVLRPGITALAIPPFMHASGHWLVFSNLYGGGKLLTLPGGRFDPVAVWETVDTEKANAIVIVGDAMARPLIDELLANPGRYDLSSLMAFGSGGAVLSPSTKEQLMELLPGRIIADLFGSSETGQVGGEAPADNPFGAPRLRVNDRTNVLDESLHIVAPGSGVVGKLARTGHIPLGYLGDPAKTAATFVEAEGRRWSLPGDMATVEADGTIIVLGRGTLSINTGGEKVFPDEVEGIIKSHPAVLDAMVVGVPDERFGERVVALVQFRDTQEVDAEVLRTFCREKLTGYKIPRQVFVVEHITRSPSGKPDYPWARKVAVAAAGGPSQP